MFNFSNLKDLNHVSNMGRSSVLLILWQVNRPLHFNIHLKSLKTGVLIYEVLLHLVFPLLPRIVVRGI